MDLQALTLAMRERMGDDSGLGGTLKFDCGADGVIVLDGVSEPNTVDNVDRETDCTVTISLANLDALAHGRLDPTMGFMTGKLKVAGKMGLALKLQKVLGG